MKRIYMYKMIKKNRILYNQMKNYKILIRRFIMRKKFKKQ